MPRAKKTARRKSAARSRASRTPGRPATKTLEQLMHEVAQTVQRSGTAQAVFGEPVKSETRTIIPVSSMSVWIGGGEGGDLDEWGSRKGGGRSGGAMLTCTPVGFIVDGPEGVRFESIGTRMALTDLLPVPMRIAAKLLKLI